MTDDYAERLRISIATKLVAAGVPDDMLSTAINLVLTASPDEARRIVDVIATLQAERPELRPR